MTQKKRSSWSIQNIWNELVTEEREMEPREYIRGSEVGRPYIERYLKMHGIAYTNPFKPRTLRIFDCGNIFEREVVERMFRLLGLLVDTQDEVTVEVDGLLPVIGHHDPRVGGKIDEEKAKKAIADDTVADWMKLRATALLEKMLEKYPDGLKEVITEVKTVNSMAFWAHKNKDPETGLFAGYPHHELQLYTYLRGAGHTEGRLFYISKDDLTLMEKPIFLDDKELEQRWLKDIRGMTEMWELSKEQKQKIPTFDKKTRQWKMPEWLQEYMPPKFTFNEKKHKHEFNWKMKRSNYLTLLTNCANEKEWASQNYRELKEMNRDECPECGNTYTLKTLNKYDGICGRCNNKLKKEEENEG